MSIADKITRLQTAKTNIANAITTKGGTVSAGDGFEDFASDIASIPSGGGGCMQDSWIDSLSSKYVDCHFSEGTELELTLTNYGTNSLNFSNAFNGSYNLKKLTVNANFMPTNMFSFFGNNGNNLVIEEICVNFSTHNATRVDSAFSGVGHWNAAAVPAKITGTPLDLSSVTSANTNAAFSNCAKLTDVRFEPNTIMWRLNMSSSYMLIDDCLVSIANGLNGSVTGQPVNLHNTPKARLSTIMGTVTDGVFTKDASGTVTLQDFITSTKGWTIA